MTTTSKRVPAEWEMCGSVLMAWPHSGTDWASRLRRTQRYYVNIIDAITRHVDVVLIGPDITIRDTIGHRNPRVHIVQMDTNDTWTRDYGPITVINADGRPEALDFMFNGWGLKFGADRDNQVNRHLQEAGVVPTLTSHQPFVLEGGSIETDGRGTLLTTTRCLIDSPNRNCLTREEMEAELSRRLGFDRFLWLEHGMIEGDDTDSHIDTLARFAPDDTIVYQGADDNDTSLQGLELRAMKKELQAFRTREGKPYRLIELPPAPLMFDLRGNRLPATYANFLAIPGCVFVPTYGFLKCDSRALAAVGQAFPGFEIRGVASQCLVFQHGSLHCATMQMPWRADTAFGQK